MQGDLFCLQVWRTSYRCICLPPGVDVITSRSYLETRKYYSCFEPEMTADERPLVVLFLGFVLFTSSSGYPILPLHLTVP
ncbi:hypothetical protein SODALDRAFT_212716 [Sodiomyces alkalinus F11]|uniref:Uncharacterized protein n=1 Tax=Sodiomyces alkalinus (strain CBS 110278 / VKM F-3762 / F11) TaxID=1314773 RepID=A0A3N2PR91_SODAK|nr:hypothetical protein SODALDRAFT_212716 [Sodiomyces alkalinus F11]ROT37005.1 hypothetical protein SODALDRAFT_212716 [Sodiomyces alkalinus F11]